MAGSTKTLNILGIRGIPAAHGGFETFAGQLAPYLRDRGWVVNVYCQLEPDASGVLAADFEDDWNGVHRIHIGTRERGSRGSISYDWRCILNAVRRPGLHLVLGYNTAIFSTVLRLRGKTVIMNMDGIEWKRAKWSLPIKVWFFFNELIGMNLSTLPIADHPEIARHLRSHSLRQPKVIPYGSERLADCPIAPVQAMGLTSGGYLVSIARIEPENSLLEIVEAFSAQPRRLKLVVLGDFQPDNAYHQRVRASASADVLFPGAIYDASIVSSLRYHALAYVHGHQVGGTNPSLVEALGAGNAVIVHDNRFNRWVAGPDQFYFRKMVDLKAILDSLDKGLLDVAEARSAARRRHEDDFDIININQQYEELLEGYL